MIPRLFSPPKGSFFLFGPRGTGKTTWLKHHIPHAIFINLLESDTFRLFSARPERLREVILPNSNLKSVVIDEVQKVPQLLPEVHNLIEKKTGIQFILTGSSSRKLKRSGIDLLAGRAQRCELHPFMAYELGQQFSLDKALNTGLIPLVTTSEESVNVLKSYASLYVREEVQMEGLVRNIGNFSRFLESISFSHGNLLSVSNVARECEIERKTVEGYIEILKDLLLAYTIPIFSKRAKRKVAVHPKFYYFDAGLFQSLRPRGALDRPEEIEGAALEGLVAQHLMAWNAYRGQKNRLYFWRTSSGTEVDFILYGEELFWALEVKRSGKVRPEDLQSLKIFRTDYPKSKLYFLYCGKEQLLIDGIHCIPIQDFLKNLHPKSLNI